MALWLRSERRRIESRSRKIRDGVAAAATARRQFAAGLRQELARPKVLLAFFAAGLGYGWLRGADTERDREHDGAEETQELQAGRLAKVVAAVVAGARIYEQVRRTAALVDRQGRS